MAILWPIMAQCTCILTRFQGSGLANGHYCSTDYSPQPKLRVYPTHHEIDRTQISVALPFGICSHLGHPLPPEKVVSIIIHKYCICANYMKQRKGRNKQSDVQQHIFITLAITQIKRALQEFVFHQRLVHALYSTHFVCYMCECANSPKYAVVAVHVHDIYASRFKWILT